MSFADNWHVRTWQTDEGLPENRVSAISLSADGYLWVATLGGLVRFDGVRFTDIPTYHFTRQPNQNVRAMLHDGTDRIWLAMDLNTMLFAHDNKVETLRFTDSTPNMAVRAMVADRSGNLWLARRNMICRSDDGVLKKIFPPNKSRVEGYSWITTDNRGEIWIACGRDVGIMREDNFQSLLQLPEACLCLTTAQDGGIWIVTPKRVLRYREGSDAQEIIKLPQRSIVRALIEDKNGALWIGTLNAGLLRWDGKSLEDIVIPRPQITALAEDREGSIWVGTDGGGLCRVRPRLFKMHNNESTLPRQSVQTTCEDAQGNIWAVLQYGALAKEHSGAWKVLTAEDGWHGDAAVCVTPAPEGGVWIGTLTAGLFRWQNGIVAQFNTENGFDIKAVRSLFCSAEGDLYIVTDWPNRLRILRDGTLREITKPAIMDAIIAIEQTADGSVWTGSSQGNLYQVADGRLNLENAAVPMVPSYVRSLHADHDTGGLWIGYGGSGLAYLQDGKYTNFRIDQGVNERFISQIIDDDQGRLWMTGNRGVFYLSKDQLLQTIHQDQHRVQPTVLGHNEGLTNIQPIWQFCPTVWHRDNGNLLLATANGVLELLPSQINYNSVAPPLSLESIRVDGQTIARRSYGLEPQDESGLTLPDPHKLSQALVLHPDHSRIEFDFTALSFVSPQNMRLFYRLRGFDPEWIAVESQRTAVYPRLPSGQYRFQIKACNESGVWNSESCGFDLRITPFFWQTWWFSLLIWSAAALGVTGLTLLIQQRRHRLLLRRVEQERAIEQERTRIARDMHDQLGSVLTKAGIIAESLRLSSPVRDQSTQTRFNALHDTLIRLTTSMDELVWAVNPRHDTLDSLADYLIRYTQEFLTHTTINCQFDIPADLPHVTLGTSLRHNLFLAFEESLNNIVKHANATEITVRVEYQGSKIVLEVEDDGCGFDTENLPVNANGVNNMRMRLQNFGGNCMIKSNVGSGTLIRFSMPVGGAAKE